MHNCTRILAAASKVLLISQPKWRKKEISPQCSGLHIQQITSSIPGEDTNSFGIASGRVFGVNPSKSNMQRYVLW